MPFGMSFDSSLQFQIRMTEIILILIIYSFTILFIHLIIVVGWKGRKGLVYKNADDIVGFYGGKVWG